eukprot:symbB.v1.2.020669.t1/scaffold1755.1/size102969/1
MLEVVSLFACGIALGCGIVKVIDVSCETCNEVVCDTHKDEMTANFPDWVYLAGTVGTIACGVLFVVFWFLHRRHVKTSKTYQQMLRAAEDYHVQCHAAVPNTPSSSHHWDSWRAQPLSLFDLLRVAQIRVFRLNIVGVGFPLYCSAMLSFLQLCVLYWLGNGISVGLFRDVVDTACLPFDHRHGAHRAAHDLALDRTWALTRLFLVSAVFHWLHAKNQRVYAREFDDRHMEMRDYSLLIDGFPEEATSEKAIAAYLQAAISEYASNSNGSAHGQLPEVVGASICFDYHEDATYVQSLVEAEFSDLSARWEESRAHRPGHNSYDSWSSAVHEVRLAWCDGMDVRELASPSNELRPDVEMSENGQDSSSEDSCSSWSPNSEMEPLESQEAYRRVQEKLRKFPNSGRVIAVFRYPVNDLESCRQLQEALKKRPYEKDAKLKVNLMSSDPPAVVFEHCVTGVHEPQHCVGCIWLSKRTCNLLLANFKILLCCALLVMGYYFIYRGVYRQQMRAESEDFIMTTLVTVSASVGNIIINQIVWSSAMDVGYRFKGDRDAYVFRWYSVITLINTVFNFGVIATTYSKKPVDDLQQVLYEAALGHQLFVFIRGSLISYAIFPVFYILLWLKGRVTLMWEYCSSKHRDVQRLRFLAEQAMEPPEWWLQYDYAAIVVMMTTSTFCLFVHGGSAWYVFTLDVLWALTMVFINRYVYLALSRETYFSTDRLDAVASRAQGVPIAMLGVCIMHWAKRSKHERTTHFCFTLVVVVSIIFIFKLEQETRIHVRRDKAVHVWYEGKPYEEAEKAVAFNWWNVNPVFCLRHKYGLLQEKVPKRRATMWRAGKSHLQPSEESQF